MGDQALLFGDTHNSAGVRDCCGGEEEEEEETRTTTIAAASLEFALATAQGLTE